MGPETDPKIGFKSLKPHSACMCACGGDNGVRKMDPHGGPFFVCDQLSSILFLEPAPGSVFFGGDIWVRKMDPQTGPILVPECCSVIYICLEPAPGSVSTCPCPPVFHAMRVMQA